MPNIKCIALHLGQDPHRQARLQVGIDLAKRFGAHLNVVCATERGDFPPGMIGRAASMAYLEELSEAAKQRMEAVRREAEAACKSLPSWEWHIAVGPVEDTVARFAHLADLVIFDQGPLLEAESALDFDVSDYVLLATGCALLLVPAKWQPAPIGRRILVAWKNAREAISAIRNAIPFLIGAEQVSILADADDRTVDRPGSDLVAYLGYHGVKAKIHGASTGGGEAILKAAKDTKADLIVMGAMGHSRWREIILGGATDHVLRHAEIPVLMRH
jgi:nucleotide-binding universal stress UspA family protein